MSDETIESVVPTEDEIKKNKIEEVRSILREVRVAEQEKMRESFATILAEAAAGKDEVKAKREEKVLESQTPEDSAVEGYERGYGKTRAAIDARYERLEPKQRAVRSPKGDAEIARYFRALLTKDSATLREMGAVTRVQLEQRLGQRAVIAVTEASHAASLMPIPLHDAVMQQINASAVLRNLVTTASSPNQQYRFPVFGKAASAMVAEGAITTGSTGPVPANVTLTKHKNQWVGSATEESVEDSDFNLAQALITAAGNGIAYTEDVQICTSQGTSPDFSGSIVTGVTDVTEGSSTHLAFADFNSLFFGVPKAYRNGSVILVDAVAAQILTELQDAGGNRVMSGIAGQAQPVTDIPNVIGSVYGMRVYEVPLASGTIWIGNPMLAYGLLTSPVMTIKQSDVAGWSTDTVQFKVTLREDGNVLIADAARKMTGLVDAI